jgi:hypothetical protein
MNETNNPFLPRSNRERFAILRRIGKTTFRVLGGAGQAHHLRGLFAATEDEGIPPKIPSFPGMYVKACLGDIYHQVTGSGYDRRRFVLRTLQVLTIFNIVDYYIDEFDFPREVREDVFDELEDAFLRGQSRESRFRQTALTSAIACEIHAEIAGWPGAEWYFEQCGSLLFDLAREEAFGSPTIEMTAEIGRGLLIAVAGILHAHDPGIPMRHIEAYGSFWAAMNLIDDVADLEHDRTHGTRTSLTVAADPEAASQRALERARALLSECAGKLQGDEILSYMTLARLVRPKWDSSVAYQESPFLGTPPFSEA